MRPLRGLQEPRVATRAQSPGREAALAWASLAQRSPASSVLAREGAGCGSVGPDILECEVKWALESITTNKANGGDGIPVELFQILKDDAVMMLHSI